MNCDRDCPSCSKDFSTPLDHAFVKASNEIMNLEKKLKIAINGLRDAEKHMDIVVGPMMNMSGTYQIIKKALAEIEKEGEK